MTDDPPPVPALTIDYANTRSGPRPMSVLAAKWVFWLSVVPGVIGVAILLLYRLTGDDNFTGLGFMWLGIGGAATFVVGVVALVNVIRALSRRPKESLPAWWYARAIVACVVNVGSAFVCAQAGSYWMEQPHFHMRVTNATTRPLNRVTVHFNSGDVAVGPLAAGQSTNTGLLWVRHLHIVRITTEVGGRTRTKDDREFGDFSSHGGKTNWTPFTIVVEPAELPKGLP